MSFHVSKNIAVIGCGYWGKNLVGISLNSVTFILFVI